jgi:hypothetical protein
MTKPGPYHRCPGLTSKQLAKRNPNSTNFKSSLTTLLIPANLDFHVIKFQFRKKIPNNFCIIIFQKTFFSKLFYDFFFLSFMGFLTKQPTSEL